MKRFLCLASCFWVTAAVVAGMQAPSRPLTMEEMHKLHQNSKRYIATLEDPARDAYQKPHEVVMALALKEGERIADIGAGAGYFSRRFAQHVGPAGRVYAVNISPEMILHLNRWVRDSGTDNVRTILAPTDDPLLPAASIDRIFICNTWHHIEGRPAYLAALKKILRPGGQIVIVDYHNRKTPVGPPMQMRLSRESVVLEFQQNGLRLAKEHTFLPYQYFLVFAP